MSRPKKHSPILRIGAATLGVAAMMNGAIGHFGMSVDRARVEQIRIARMHECATSVLNDLDSLLLGERAESLDGDLGHLEDALRDVTEKADPDEVAPLRRAYAEFVAAAGTQTGLARKGRHDEASAADQATTDPAYDRLENELRRMDRLCQARAERSTAETFAATFATLLLSAGLVSFFAARYRQRADRLTDLEVQRHAVEAGERRIRFHLDLMEAKRGLTDPHEIVATMVAFLSRSLGASGGLFAVGSPESPFTVESAWGSLASGPSSPLGEAIAASLATGEKKVVEDARAETPQRTKGKLELPGAYVTLPVVRDGLPKAVLALAQNDARAWTAEDLSRIEEIGTRCFARFAQGRAEAAVRRSEEHIRFFFDALSNGVWEWDLAEDAVVWSHGMFTLLGLDPATVVPSVDAMRALVLPEDRDEFEAMLGQRNEQNFSTRLRLRGREGSVHSVLAQCRTQFDAQGNALRSVGTFTDLTRLFEAEKAKAKVEHESRHTMALLEAQLNSSLDGIVIVHPNGHRILQNARLAKVWGIPADVIDDPDDSRQLKLVGARVKHPQAFKDSIAEIYAHPDRVQEDEIELVDGTILERHTAPAIDPDGGIHGRIWTFRDVTEKNRTLRSIRDNERRLLLLMESMPQIVYTCLPDGWNLSFNRRWTEYTGLSEDESAGHGWRQAFHPDEQSTGSHATREPVAYEVECRLRRADGVYRWFLIRGLPMLDASGQVAQWFGTCTDIDDLKLSEEFLREAQEELEARVDERTRDLAAATLEAERANAAKSEFLSRMSHELRTPLNAILGFGQILGREELDPLQRESVDYILEGGRHLLGLINDILDISKMESGITELSVAPVMVADVLEESLAMVRHAAAERGISIEANADLFRGVCVAADRQHLKQVFLNLLSNAVKYNRPNGTVTLDAAEEGQDAFRVAIRDTGLGISEEGLVKLFTPFERLNAASDVEGTGLGLFISQKLLSAMGGELMVESHLGVGSIFTVALPRAQPATELLLSESASSLPTVGEAPSDRPFVVLCIEDHAANARLVERMVATRPNVRLTTTTDGREGVRLAREVEPDLILLDLNLPDLSGLEVMERLRRSATTDRIPVVVISADASNGNALAALQAGAEEFLTKPLDVERFFRTLDAHLALDAQRETPMEKAA